MHSSLPFTQNPKPRTIEPTPNHFHPSLFSVVSRSLLISFHTVSLYFMFVTKRESSESTGSWSIHMDMAVVGQFIEKIKN